MIFAASSGIATLLIELGAVLLGLAFVGRLANRVGIPSIPLYLLAGLAFGEGGVLELVTAREFIEPGSEIGVLLLLLMLGLEYSGRELVSGLRSNAAAGALDLVANFTPGLALGLVLGWDVRAALLLGGISYISSSGIIAKLLADLGRTGNRETPSILAILVTEDLVMAIYLPLMAGFLVGGSAYVVGLEISIAIVLVAVALFAAIRFGDSLSRIVFDRSPENLLLTLVGLTLLAGGLAERMQVSAAVGAFIVGIALSGPAQAAAHDLLSPLRDLFAAMFFALFGLQIDPADLVPMLPIALGLAVVTAATKFWTGWWSARSVGVGTVGRMRAGTALIARGEFSIVIAEIAVVAGLEPDIGPLSAAYVLMLAIAGPLLTRAAEPLARRAVARRRADGRLAET